MSQGLYSGVSGLALGSGLYRNVSGLWGGASGLIDGFGGGTAPALSLDFANQSYIMNDAGYQFQDLIRFSRTTAGTFVGSDGFIQNTPISKNLLLWTEEQENATWVKNASSIQTNFLKFSQEFDNATVWADTLSGTGLATTVTPNAGAAPDGSTTADRIQLNLGGGTTLSDYVRRRQSYVTPVGQYTYSIYLKSFDGVSTYNMHIVAPSGQTILIVVTPTWQRFTVTANGIGAGVTYGVGLRGGLTPANSNTADVLAWGAQLVQGATAGDYMVTGASTAAVQYTGPNGLLSAVKLVADNAAAFGTTYIRQNITKAASALTYTTSVYAKAAEFNRVRLFVRDNTAGANSASVTVSLVDGSITTAANAIGTFTGASAAVTGVGDGWYRVALTFTTGTETNIWGQTVFTEDSVATTGDGTSGIYIYGAQVELASSATSYSRNADGLYPPRFDYDPVTLAPKGILIEEQRTNLLTYSEQFDNAAWLINASSVTVTANAATSPDGTVDADKLIIANGVSSGTTTYLYTNISKSAVATTYTFSCYAKEAEYDLFRIVINDNAATANFALGAWSLIDGSVNEVPSVGGTFTNPSGTVTAVGNGWYRITLTFTSSTETSLRVRIYPRDSSGVVVGDGVSGIYIYGAQLEAGAFVTSYMPTVASTTTRAADITLVNSSIFTSFYNQDAGTLFADVIPQVSNAQNQFIATLSDGTTTNRASMFKATSGFGGFRTTSSGTAANPTGPVSAPLTGNVRHKVALSVTTGSNNVTCAVDGALGTAATLSTMPTGINSLRVGINEAGTADWLNGNIRAVRYYSVSQTTAELQALTTL